jgi:hypothetical protein
MHQGQNASQKDAGVNQYNLGMDKRCPLKKTCLPDKPCHHGRRAIDFARRGKKGGCPWFVASQEANYCFFALMAEEGDRPIESGRIASLLLIDDSEVKRITAKFKAMAGEHLDTRTVEMPQI